MSQLVYASKNATYEQKLDHAARTVGAAAPTSLKFARGAILNREAARVAEACDVSFDDVWVALRARLGMPTIPMRLM